MVMRPLGISESMISSGNSTSCRMMNSRNSFILISTVAALGERRSNNYRKVHDGHRPSLQARFRYRCRVGRSNRRRRARRLLFVLFYQTAHGIGGLRATRDPMLDPIQLQSAIVTGLLRIV